MVGGGKAASGLTVDGDEVGVAAKHDDVVMDPLEAHHLVPHPGIARDILRAQGQEAERSESVPDGDHNDVMREVVERSKLTAGSISSSISSSMDPEEDRK